MQMYFDFTEDARRSSIVNQLKERLGEAQWAAVTAEALTYGQVHNVAYTTNGVRLDLGLTGQYSILDIRKVIG